MSKPKKDWCEWVLTIFIFIEAILPVCLACACGYEVKIDLTKRVK